MKSFLFIDPDYIKEDEEADRPETVRKSYQRPALR